MSDFLDCLERRVRAASARAAPSFERGPVDRPKRAAWSRVEGQQRAGQIMVWDSGEVEAEVYSIDDFAVIDLTSAAVQSNAELEALFDEWFATVSG